MPTVSLVPALKLRTAILMMVVFFPCTLLRAQSATTNAATNVGDLSVTLNGVVNPGGVSNWVYFQYGTTTSYGQAIGAVPASITGPADVTESVVLNYLLPNTTYHFRMATDPAGMASRYGADMTFTTGPPTTPPGTGTPVTNSVYTTLAQVSCGVSGGSSQATVSVEYGTTTSYGLVATPQSPMAEIGTNLVSKPTAITGLQPGTTYHFRFKAVNNEGTTYSPDAIFTTLDAPVITTGAVSAVTDLSATMNGTLDRKGGQYTISAQYGTTTSYGQSAGLGSTTLLTGAQPFSNPISTLLPNTTYHFRIAVTDIFNVTYYGTDDTFTTAAANTPPEVLPNGVAGTAQTPTRAELFLTWLKTGSSATTVSYEYGPTTSYGSVAVNPTPKPVNTLQEIYVAPVQLTGLTPGTTYHFRGKAVNAQGTVYTNDQTFTTAAGPVLTIGGIPGATTSATDLAANLFGTVNTNSLLLEVSFEYGTSTSYGSTESTWATYQNTSAVLTSVNVAYLQPSTTYHYRIKAVNHWQPLEVFYSADATFTTAAPNTPPYLGAGLSASNVLTRSAQLQCASISTGSSPTTVVFHYGTTTAYGSTATYATTLPINTVQSAAVTLSGLTPGTTYHATVIATNAQGSTTGSDITFTTLAARPPSIGTISTQQARTTAAQVQALNVSAGSADATLVWDYGLTTDYGTTAPATPSTMTTDTTGTVTGVLSGLQANTTYHYRCRATSVDGNATSADGTFTTGNGPPAPITTAATSVTDLSATLNGSASTTVGDLTAFFDFGTTTSYGIIVNPGSPTISSATSTPVFEYVVGLLPNTTYHYRLNVRDLDGNVYSGSDMSFTTGPPNTPPTGNTATADSLSAYGATLKAYVSSGSSPATIVFQYGTTTSYGSQITHATPLATSQQYELITDLLSGLTPSTTYHYRVVVTNNEGSNTGADVSFTTPALPTVTTGTASSIQPTAATLNGTYQAQGGTYTRVFDYGETTAYGLTATPSGLTITLGGGGLGGLGGGIIIGGGGLGGGIIIGGGGGGGSSSVSATAAVQPQKTYHFRLRLTDSYGNSFPGSDATFTTPAAIEAWRQLHFGSTADAGNASDNANPAGDGIPNLMKYALWMTPTQSGVQPPPTTVTHNGARYLGLSFPRNPSALDVTYEVQAADSPAGPWTTITTIPPGGGSPSGPGFINEQVLTFSSGFGSTPVITSDTVYVRDTVSLDSAPRRFLRIQVQRQ